MNFVLPLVMVIVSTSAHIPVSHPSWYYSTSSIHTIVIETLIVKSVKVKTQLNFLHYQYVFKTIFLLQCMAGLTPLLTSAL